MRMGILIPDHKGKASSFSLNMILAVGLSYMAFVIVRHISSMASLMAQLMKYLPPRGRYRINPWVRRILWKRKWQPTPVFLPRKSHGQKSLAGKSPWDCKWVGHYLATKQQHFSYTQYVGALYYRWILNFVTCFSASIWIIIWLFCVHFVHVVYNIDLHILNHSCIINSHLVMLCFPLNVLLNLVC